MAENKKSFLLYCDLIHTVRKMPKDKQADLFLHILEYVNDENPETDDLIIQLTFEPIKQQMKRDLIKWSETIEVRSKAGKESAKRRAEQKATNPTHVDFVQQDSTNPTVTENVNVNVNVTDTVIKSDSAPPTLTANGKVFFIPSTLDDFKPPTFGEVKQCFSQQKPTDWDYTKSLVLAEKFYTNYEANGWKINGMPIGNWQALVKKWILKEIETPKNGNKQSVSDKAASGIELAKAALAQSLNKIAASRGFNNSEEVCSTANAKPYT